MAMLYLNEELPWDQGSPEAEAPNAAAVSFGVSAPIYTTTAKRRKRRTQTLEERHHKLAEDGAAPVVPADDLKVKAA